MAMSAVYTNFGGMLLYENRGGTERQYVSDTLGSLVGELDSTQATTYTAEYWPYGEVQTETGTNTSPWNFVGLLGYLRDLSTLLYVRARHYLNAKARWLTIDPLWPGEAPYSYAHNSPEGRIDLSGLQSRGIGEILGVVPPGSEPCTQSTPTQIGLRCLGAGDCVENTDEYGLRFSRTGNKLDRCASCVSSAICFAIAGGTLGGLAGGGLGGPLSQAAKECIKCQNNCMIDAWRQRSSPAWQRAKRLCAAFGESSPQCCRASVLAEQNGYDLCAPKCCKPLTLLPLPMRLFFALGILHCCD